MLLRFTIPVIHAIVIAVKIRNEHEEKGMKAVVFDIGNVLVNFRWRELFADLGFEGEKFETISSNLKATEEAKKGSSQ